MVSEQAGSDVFRATQPGRSRGDDPGATSSERHSQVAREETTRERPLAATCRGRSASICLAEFMFSQGPFGHFIMHIWKKIQLEAEAWRVANVPDKEDIVVELGGASLDQEANRCADAIAISVTRDHRYASYIAKDGPFWLLPMIREDAVEAGNGY
ncbi:hypothetical protein F2Q68_00029419 [Brassica cretica]|uniref:Uncharacterized protein n=1 Tax=Brassica cretica TaxID=69181 RepID=A0A8S9GE15_BRACR|nr:hypothetical protein F2Q68_00029419 [Brassica cretica]